MEAINIKNDFNLRGITDNDYILQRNGTDMVCPIVPPVMMKQPTPTTAGQIPQPPQMIATRTSCSSMCPLFELKNDEKGILSSVVSCGSTPIVRNISKVVSVSDQMVAVKGSGMKAVN